MNDLDRQHPTRRDDQLTPVDGIARGLPSQHVAESLRRGRCLSDRAFDRFLPYEMQLVSGQHWTPLPVALRVAQWLESASIKSVVDIGSGAGKFCVATALASSCNFTGIEQRPGLVNAARELAQTFDLTSRVRFIRGIFGHTPIPPANAYYLFNPFGENTHRPEEQIDHEVELSHARYERELSATTLFLAQAPVGTYVIKYNGFGGRMPDTYDPVHVDLRLPCVLRMWQKVRT